MKKIILLTILICIPFFCFSKQIESLKTEHFEIIYPEESKKTAELIYKNAENVYTSISDLIGNIGENINLAVVIRNNINPLNAYYTGYPYHTIVLYDTFGNSSSTLNYKEKMLDIFTHELTHALLFNHKDKFWQVMGNIFSDAFTIQGLYIHPSFSEGLSVYAESRYGTGRLNSNYFLHTVKQAKIEEKFPGWFKSIGSSDYGTYFGSAYSYGGPFVAYLAYTFGEEKLSEFFTKSSSLVFKTVSGLFKETYGKEIEEVWEDFRSSIKTPQTILHGNAVSPKSSYNSIYSQNDKIYALNTKDNSIDIFNADTGVLTSKTDSYGASSFNVSESGKIILGVYSEKEATVLVLNETRTEKKNNSKNSAASAASTQDTKKPYYRFEAEHRFTGYFAGFSFNKERYALLRHKSGTTTIDLYNSRYILYKSITLPYSADISSFSKYNDRYTGMILNHSGISYLAFFDNVTEELYIVNGAEDIDFKTINGNVFSYSEKYANYSMIRYGIVEISDPREKTSKTDSDKNINSQNNANNAARSNSGTSSNNSQEITTSSEQSNLDTAKSDERKADSSAYPNYDNSIPVKKLNGGFLEGRRISLSFSKDDFSGGTFNPLLYKDKIYFIAKLSDGDEIQSTQYNSSTQVNINILLNELEKEDEIIENKIQNGNKASLEEAGSEGIKEETTSENVETDSNSIGDSEANYTEQVSVNNNINTSETTFTNTPENTKDMENGVKTSDDANTNMKNSNIASNSPASGTTLTSLSNTSVTDLVAAVPDPNGTSANSAAPLTSSQNVAAVPNPNGTSANSAAPLTSSQNNENIVLSNTTGSETSTLTNNFSNSPTELSKSEIDITDNADNKTTSAELNLPDRTYVLTRFKNVSYKNISINTEEPVNKKTKSVTHSPEKKQSSENSVLNRLSNSSFNSLPYLTKGSLIPFATYADTYESLLGPGLTYITMDPYSRWTLNAGAGYDFENKSIFGSILAEEEITPVLYSKENLNYRYDTNEEKAYSEFETSLGFHKTFSEKENISAEILFSPFYNSLWDMYLGGRTQFSASKRKGSGPLDYAALNLYGEAKYSILEEKELHVLTNAVFKLPHLLPIEFKKHKYTINLPASFSFAFKNKEHFTFTASVIPFAMELQTGTKYIPFFFNRLTTSVGYRKKIYLDYRESKNIYFAGVNLTTTPTLGMAAGNIFCNLGLIIEYDEKNISAGISFSLTM